MAEYTTLIFPTDQHHMPSDEAIARASSYLNELYRGHYAPVAKKHKKVTLLDSGADFDRFTCPRCGSTVKMHDPSGWWFTYDWSGISREDQPLKVPCCNASVPLNELGVSNLTGLALFNFEIDGAGEEYLPNQEQLSHIGSILGCGVRHLISVFD